jgi:hypothetical protein
VLNLQGDLDTVEKTIQHTRTAISTSKPSKYSLKILSRLEKSHDYLKQEVEILYASLNVHDSFPELENINLDFVQTLLMARDLKINIRKRAIGSFFEWEKLDQAVGGREEALGEAFQVCPTAAIDILAGTKLHQHTRKAIAKRKPALMAAIRKFNGYCERLAMLYDPSWSIPLPRSLPTQLAALRDSSDLMEDVWITPTPGVLPAWLDDRDVREGIRAMLKKDRCLEERRRLGMEADNLCRWFGRELTAVELAIQTPTS